VSELQRHEGLAETAYEAMYEATSNHGAKTHYEDACHHFRRAIAAARETGQAEEAARLEQRLTHVRTVYDHQFRGV
jgi:hypothetical protein